MASNLLNLLVIWDASHLLMPLVLSTPLISILSTPLMILILSNLLMLFPTV
uniref:Uncharacterized protein n=1 Tax=Arundo donax TaxID=35708 RepID=A0A0A9F767_ARUDO